MQLILRGLVLLCTLTLLACAGPGPIVEYHAHALAPGVLAKVAVVPF